MKRNRKHPSVPPRRQRGVATLLIVLVVGLAVSVTVAATVYSLRGTQAKQLTMTALADGVVYSRSGLTHQAKLLEQAGLITRTGCPDDQRATVVTITDAGLALIQRLMPGHIEVVRDLMFDAMSDRDLHALAEIMTRARDHMRAQPPRSATGRRRRTAD